MTSLAEHLGAEACPHLAVFLRSADELPSVLVSFYSLGLRRGGWLAHRALPGDAEREWHRMSRDRPVVTICPFIVGDADPSVVSEMHTDVLVPEDGEYTVLRPG